MSSETYRIGELASLAGVTRRTIHYYISKGLIPPAKGAGVSSYYNQDHLNRIMLIKKLQESYLPLVEIRKLVTPLNAEQVIRYFNQHDEKIQETVSQPMDSQELERKQSKLYLTPAPIALYERIKLGKGIELHYPAELRENEPGLVKKAISSIQKLLDDGKHMS